MDDLIGQPTSMQEMIEQLEQVMNNTAKQGITFSRCKFKISPRVVETNKDEHVKIQATQDSI